MTRDHLLTYLTCAIWIGMLASIPYGISTGDALPTVTCIVGLILLDDGPRKR